MTRKYHPDGSPPAPGAIFVFGSNLSGIHGGGAARAAHELYGAQWGYSAGMTGQSYAIPTVKHNIAGPLPIESIAGQVDLFLAFARWHLKDMQFHVTRIGCGLAGHKDEDIAPLFINAPENCSLPEPWRAFIGD